MTDTPTTEIQNVVTSATTPNRFDLGEICRQIPEAVYRPYRFPGLCLRLTRPKSSTLLFTNGKLVCTGAKSVRASTRAIHRVLRLLQRHGIPVDRVVTTTVRNVVGSADLGAHVDLDRASYTLDRCMYEPEQFPGLIYRMTTPKVVILVFASGKLVITGATTEAQIPQAADEFHATLAAQHLLYPVQT